MTAPTTEQALEGVYEALASDNKDIDLHIDRLRAVLKSTGQKEAVLDPSRLFQNNRDGRKTLQAYFRRRGVKVVFKS